MNGIISSLVRVYLVQEDSDDNDGIIAQGFRGDSAATDPGIRPNKITIASLFMALTL
jgi:hypothetical protein